MEDNKLIKYENGQLAKVNNAIAVTNKILDLAKTEPLLIPYRKGNKWGYCTEDKTIVIDCVYDWVYPFVNGIAIVKLIDKWKFIDINGTDVLMTNYDDISQFFERIAVRYKSKELDWNKLQENCTIKYHQKYIFSDDLTLVKRDEIWGYINRTGIEYWEE